MTPASPERLRDMRKAIFSMKSEIILRDAQYRINMIRQNAQDFSEMMSGYGPNSVNSQRLGYREKN